MPGARCWRAGGSAMDAVKAAILPMEEQPAVQRRARGGVHPGRGRNELDASIMDGRDRSAGAGGPGDPRRSSNPILLADVVRTESPHVMLMGEGRRNSPPNRALP